MKPYLYILLLTFFIALNCKAQKILVFDRDGHVKRIRFKVNDDISVRMSDTTSWEYGVITDISDSTITVRGDVIVVSKIKAIKFDRRGGGIGLLQQAAVTLPAAGVVLLSFDAIDAAINNYHPVYSESTLITAGALIVAGPIAYFFTFHKYKINKHHRLKVIDVSIN